MERSWIFLQNPFINATRTSYRQMKQIGDLTLAAIAVRVPPTKPTPMPRRQMIFLANCLPHFRRRCKRTTMLIPYG